MKYQSLNLYFLKHRHPLLTTSHPSLGLARYSPLLTDHGSDLEIRHSLTVSRTDAAVSDQEHGKEQNWWPENLPAPLFPSPAPKLQPAPLIPWSAGSAVLRLHCHLLLHTSLIWQKLNCVAPEIRILLLLIKSYKVCTELRVQTPGISLA